MLPASQADPHVVRLCVSVIAGVNVRMAEFAVFMVPTVRDDLFLRREFLPMPHSADTVYFSTVSCRGGYPNRIDCMKNDFFPSRTVIENHPDILGARA
jgi:hypothetical protein